MQYRLLLMVIFISVLYPYVNLHSMVATSTPPQKTDAFQRPQEMSTPNTHSFSSTPPELEGPEIVTNPATGELFLNPKQVIGLAFEEFEKLHPSAKGVTKNSAPSFCLPWSVDSDEWWTHNIKWIITSENATHYCFGLDQSNTRAKIFRELYQTQFTGNCTNVKTKRMWSTGWAADILNLVDGLSVAHRKAIPFQVVDTPWHYAASKDGKVEVCPERNMRCYFLPFGTCPPKPSEAFEGQFYGRIRKDYRISTNRILYDFLTRQRTWVRKAVYDFVQSIDLPTPCTVVHVRRGDIVLHENESRRYIPLEEYMEASKNITKTVLLLTDDDNAIKEAQFKYPNHTWVYSKKARFKGKEGGWENHFPSGDPKYETIELLATFRLAQKCKVFIHGVSRLSNLIAGQMLNVHTRHGLIEEDLSTREDPKSVRHPKNQDSYNVSRSDWGG